MKASIIILFLILFTISPGSISISAEELHGLCIKVFDGDTIAVRLDRKDSPLAKGSDTIHIRLIGVDTPELNHPLKPVQYFAQEATSFTTKMVSGKRVRLEFDSEKVDKYGRVLAYVLLPDGRMLNAEIIKHGYGFAYTKFPFRYMEEFRRYERDARSKGYGLWKGGGKSELKWLIQEKIIPFKVYEMANDLWAVEYQRYIKTRLTNEELIAVLGQLRVWVHEFNEKDLRNTLLKEGWEEMD